MIGAVIGGLVGAAIVVGILRVRGRRERQLRREFEALGLKNPRGIAREVAALEREQLRSAAREKEKRV